MPASFFTSFSAMNPLLRMLSMVPTLIALSIASRKFFAPLPPMRRRTSVCRERPAPYNRPANTKLFYLYKGCKLSDLLTTCEEAARAGGAVLLDWVGRFSVREKGPSDLVTQADEAAQEAVQRVLKNRFPNHDFVGEEQATRPTLLGEFCWYVDPLDGTTNYVHQVPHYCTSVALARHGQVLVSAIYDPVSQECFTAERGKGAFCNGRRLQTSSASELSQALTAASFSAKVDPNSVEIDQFVQALLRCQAVRRTGSAALNMCYVAAGRFDCFWALTTKAWDVAAGALLIEEAGGIVTHWTGSPFELSQPHPAASATKKLHQQFLELLAEAKLAKS